MKSSRNVQTSWSWWRGWFWLPVTAKPVNVMRGEPVVMPLAFCQWFDHVVRFSLARLKNAYPTLTSFTARFENTCVSCPIPSLLFSSVVFVAAGLLFDAPAPNGSNSRPQAPFPINRVLDEIW